MTFGLPENSLELIKQTIKQFPDIEEARIFGSRAMGNYRKGSDVDIAIFGQNLTPDTLSKLSFQLNEELPLPYFFDVIDASTLEHQELKKHIEDIGKKL